MSELVEAIVVVIGQHDDPEGWTCDENDQLVYECCCGDRSKPLDTDYIDLIDREAAADWHRRHLAEAIADLVGMHAKPAMSIDEVHEELADLREFLGGQSSNST